MDRVCNNPRVIEVDYCEFYDESPKRKVARSVMSMFADMLVSPDDGVVSGFTLSQRHFNTFKNHDISDAIDHWVSHAWYEKGKAYFRLSPYIQ